MSGVDALTTRLSASPIVFQTFCLLNNQFHYYRVVLQITDSPGLCDTKRSPEDVAAEVVQAVACMHPGPTAILYVIAIGRYTEEDQGVYERVKSLLDDRVTQYIIIIFTRGDDLARHPGGSRHCTGQPADCTE